MEHWESSHHIKTNMVKHGHDTGPFESAQRALRGTEHQGRTEWIPSLSNLERVKSLSSLFLSGTQSKKRRPGRCSRGIKSWEFSNLFGGFEGMWIPDLWYVFNHNTILTSSGHLSFPCLSPVGCTVWEKQQGAGRVVLGKQKGEMVDED